MAKSKTSLRSVIVFGLIAAGAVAAIGFKSFGNLNTLLIAVGITFVVVVLSILVLRGLQKDDPVEPGKPRLK